MISVFDQEQMDASSASLAQASGTAEVCRRYLTDLTAGQDGRKWGSQWGPVSFMSQYTTFLMKSVEGITSLADEMRTFSQGVTQLKNAVDDNDAQSAAAFNTFLAPS